MKRIALPVCAFAALLIVSVGCQSGDSGNMIAPSGTQMRFVASPTSVSTGAPVEFTITASNPRGIELLSLVIDFESDGTWDAHNLVQRPSVDLTFTHVYTTAGTYTALAELGDQTGAVITRTTQVTVTSPLSVR